MLSENALRVLQARYLRRGARGEVIETPEQLFERVARAISEAELLSGSAADARYWEDRFHRMLASLDFLPNSPTLMNAGTSLGQLSACFVLPIEDSMESIFGTLRDAAMIQRTGGGTGFSFSHLRPAGDVVSSTGGSSSGPVSFMKIYDSATENIKQGGRRRGANMGILRVDHPDIEEFIQAKRDGHSLRNFNISVGVTDEFMSAVDGGSDLDLRHPATGRVLRTIAARTLFDQICESAWATGDPGLIFLDSIERANPVPFCAIESTNPCGEVPLCAYESCNLGSINLVHFVDNDRINWDRLGTQVDEGVRFLDDAISVNRFPLEATERITLANRKIGIGVMGFAELCILLGVSYAGDRAISLAEETMAFVARQARLASARLANERGTFPNWSRSTFAERGIKLRNATQTSIAPTGTIGIIAGTSAGIEPLFALAYRREGVLGDQSLAELNPLLVRHLQRAGRQSELVAVARTGRLSASCGELEKIFVTALEVRAEQHVRVQAAFQRYVDNAVSKTVNLPENASPTDIAAIYRLAYKLGCKGVTVFRYGSKPGGVLQLGLGESPEDREYFAKCDPGACRL